MCKREHYTFNRTFHITIPRQKNGCANFIITLFQLIKCMIIPWREIREGDTTWQSFCLSLGSEACCWIMPFGRHFLYDRYGNCVTTAVAESWSSFHLKVVSGFEHVSEHLLFSLVFKVFSTHLNKSWIHRKDNDWPLWLSFAHWRYLISFRVFSPIKFIFLTYWLIGWVESVTLRPPASACSILDWQCGKSCQSKSEFFHLQVIFECLSWSASLLSCVKGLYEHSKPAEHGLCQDNECYLLHLWVV